MRGTKIANSAGYTTGTAVARPLGGNVHLLQPKVQLVLTVGVNTTTRGFRFGFYGSLEPQAWAGVSIQRFEVDLFGDAFELLPLQQFPNVNSLLVSVSGFTPFTATWQTSSYQAAVPGLHDHFTANTDKQLAIRMGRQS